MLISDELAKKLEDRLYSLMSQYARNDNGSDYLCAFCQRTGDTIAHNTDCLGKELEKCFAEWETPDAG